MNIRTKRLIPVMAAAAVLGGMCGAAAAYASSSGGTSYVPKPLHHNTHGLTYGSAADVSGSEPEPDLILVVATNGKEGYAYSAQIDGPPPASPAEAASRSNAARVVPVYESDGTTRIGSFVVGGQGGATVSVPRPR